VGRDERRARDDAAELGGSAPGTLDWLPHSPFRRPDWRWRRAQWLLKTGRPRDRRVDDGWVDRAAAFLARAAGPGRADGAVGSAAALAGGVGAARDVLEAYLLTELPLAQAAARAGVAAAAAEAYHALFFCVRDQPAARDWLALYAVRPGPPAGFGPGEVGLVWKHFARAGGSAALEAVRAVAPDAAALARLAAAPQVAGLTGGVAGAALRAVAELVRPPEAPAAWTERRARRRPTLSGRRPPQDEVEQRIKRCRDFIPQHRA
jgi:hypothetical protein